MSYLVLARKYRPQTFSDIVGQEAIAATLKNAVAAKRLAHAFLFFGPRGVGKTTTARILAKAANCAKGPTPEPCNKCSSCLEITAGNALDVLEIDAASNTGVDNVREAIVDTVALVPARDRYKIFIIDEVHMLSTNAFNALLKTLEEPPAHALFILATTESQKVPATILSRCQRYRFRPVPQAEITARLAHILKEEKLKVEEEVLTLVAKAATGSLRDALSLLDQALAYAEGGLKTEHLQELLGFLPEELVKDFASKILNGDRKGLLEAVAQASDQGYDLPQLVRDLREHFRNRLHTAVEKGAQEASSVDAFLRQVKGLTRCLEEMRFSDQLRLLVELHLLRLASPAVDIAHVIERLESLSSSSPSLPPSPPPSPHRAEGTTSPLKGEGVKKEEVKYEPPSSSAGERREVVREPKATSYEPPAGTDPWVRFVEKVKQVRPSVAAYLNEAGCTPAAGRWTIHFPHKFSQDGAQRHLALLEQVLSGLEGRPMKISFESKPEGAPVAVAPAPVNGRKAGPETGDVFEDPAVKSLLDTFEGSLRSLE